MQTYELRSYADRHAWQRFPRQITDLHLDQLKRLSLDTNDLTQLPELPISLEKISVQNNLLDRLPGHTQVPCMDILCHFGHEEVLCLALSDTFTENDFSAFTVLSSLSRSQKTSASSKPLPERQLPHGAAFGLWTTQEFEGEKIYEHMKSNEGEKM